jgi:hypothetical protein
VTRIESSERHKVRKQKNIKEKCSWACLEQRNRNTGTIGSARKGFRGNWQNKGIEKIQERQ